MMLISVYIMIQIRIIRLLAYSHVVISINLTSTCMHPSRRTYIPCVPATRCTSQNVFLVSFSLSTQLADLSWPPYDLHPTNLFCRIPVVGPRTYGRKRYSGLKILS